MRRSVGLRHGTVGCNGAAMIPRSTLRPCYATHMKRFLSFAAGFVLVACSDGPAGAPDGGDNDAGPGDSGADVPGPDAGDDSGSYSPNDPTMTAGAPDRFLLLGKIVTPDTEIDGQVLVEAGLITCVDAGTVCSTQAGAMGATIIVTNGVIAPGLIDTHNHILFDMFDDDDWLPTKVYQNHNQWTAEPKYAAMVDVKQCLANDSAKPAWCAMTSYGNTLGSLRCEIDKFGELKGLIAGTTSIVGLPGTSASCFSSLARSIDVAQNGFGIDKIQTSALFPPSNPDGVCANYASMKTDAFLVHTGEGVDATARNEFASLGTMTATQGCLYAPQTAITHGTAFGATEFQAMAAKGMKLTWSPASNNALYQQTTDVPAALAAGVKVSLAPDWSMGGSQNLLDELRFANAWDDQHWSNKLSPKDLVVMTTKNPAEQLALSSKIGEVKVGLVADLFVVSGDASKPYDAILGATPKTVAMVMVGGQILYGDVSIKAAGPATPGCETLDICTKQKFLCVATTDATNKLNQTYAEIKAALEKGLADSDTATANDGFDFAPLAPLVRCK